jgi:ATP-dependent DNA helicase Q4
LRLNSVIRKELKVKCVLALTATATKMTEESIVNLLELDQSSGSVLRLSSIRKNLHVTVSKDLDKYKALLSILKSDLFKLSNTSVIVYCNLQHTTDDLANYLKHHQLNAHSYHAGKTTSERKKIQNQFMNNEVSIIVSTVAFGMGIDKQDIRAVIHFNLPRSVENYVQVRI